MTDPPSRTNAVESPTAQRRSARHSIGYAALLLLFFGAPISVSAVFRLIPGLRTSVLLVTAAGFMLGLHLLRIRRVRVDRAVLLVLALLFLPMFVSFVLVPLNSLSTGIDYSGYASWDLWSRMVNIVLYGMLFIGGCTVILELPEERRIGILRAYLAALWIFIAVGVWQWGSFYLGLPFPDLGSRTYLHSVPGEIARFFPGRLTSLATEPSFVAPLMIDAAILGAAVMGPTRRYVALVLVPAAWVLLFSFSGGGFLNLLVVGGFVLLLGFSDMFARGRIDRRVLVVAVLAICTVLALNKPLRQLFVPVLGRMGMLFDLEAHDRLYMVVMPFSWFADDGVVSALFGHGPGSFILLRQLHRLPEGGVIHVTSNNLFTDVLYEQGLVGLLLVVALFTIAVVAGLRRRSRSRECFLGAVMTVHLATSSMYRADFMAPRFWVVLLSIYVLYHLGPSGRIERGRRRGAEFRAFIAPPPSSPYAATAGTSSGSHTF